MISDTEQDGIAALKDSCERSHAIPSTGHCACDEMFYVINPEDRSQGVLGSIISEGYASLQLAVAACASMSQIALQREVPLIARRQIIQCDGLFKVEQDVMSDDILYLFTDSGQPMQIRFR